MRARFAALVLLCIPMSGLADGHREAVLRLVSLSSAIRAEAAQAKGMLGMDMGSRMAAPECAQLFQDIVSMRHLQAVRAEPGDAVVVRWRGERELKLQARRAPSLALDVHDNAGPACAVTAVKGDAKGWQGKLTPVLLDFPGLPKGPAQVFPVDPVRSPDREPLK
jgi:hypothetical protein